MFLRLVTGLCLLEVVFGASCYRTFTSSSGTVTSPDYQSSHNYANNLNCQYDIRVSSGNAIRLTWTLFDVKGKMPSCYNDYVEIFIGCNRRSIGRYCSENSYTTPFDVYSPDNCLRLKFRSDSSGTGRGFRATYSKVSYIFGTSSLSSSCSSSVSKYSNSGVINSPRWPRVYTTIGSCYWKIEVGSSKGVKIAFMDFDLDSNRGCDNDKVKVKGGRSYDSYDDSSTVKDSMCGSKSPFYFTSTKDRIWIRFKSDGSLSNRGFVAGYVTYDLDSSSSGGSIGGTVGGIVVAVIVFVCIVGCIYYVFVYRRRLAMRQATHHQAMTTQVNVASQQAVVHHPPPPTQPGYGPPPPAGYGPPPPPAGGSAPPFQPGVAPPPYNQVVGVPYPQQDKSGPYPPPGAAPYPPGQAGGPPSYPPGQPGGMAPYPPAQPQGLAPYPPEPSTGAAPYPTGPPGGAPYPPK